MEDAVLTDENPAARQDMQEWIQIVRVRAVEPIQEQPGITTSRSGKDLQGRLRETVAALFAAHNKNGAVGHNQSCGIPALALEERCADELVVAFLSREKVAPAT